jgi:SAM-dependent methyltransferase
VVDVHHPDPAAYIEALILVHRGLPRQGPGDAEITRQVLRLLPGLPAQPQVADLGCGSGAAALVLAAELGVTVKALDFARPFLDELQVAARERGLEHLVEIVQADMAQPPLPAASLDLIWSEGAAYSLTFAGALEKWRPLLQPGGYLVASEITWLLDGRPETLQEFWDEGYPQMADEAGNRAHAEAAGFSVLATELLPPRFWWSNYYGPLKLRMDKLRNLEDPVLAQVILEAEVEMELFRQYSDWYGYVFYVLQPRD